MSEKSMDIQHNPEKHKLHWNNIYVFTFILYLINNISKTGVTK